MRRQSIYLWIKEWKVERLVDALKLSRASGIPIEKFAGELLDAGRRKRTNSLTFGSDRHARTLDRFHTSIIHSVPTLKHSVQSRTMRIGLKKVADDALKLPARSRARLAERLIMSLEETEDPQAERKWLIEIERRSVELKSGKATGVLRSARPCASNTRK